MENTLESNQINEILLSALQRSLQKKIDPSTLSNNTKLCEELGLGRLAIMETVWEIEGKFHIYIDESELPKMSTVGDVIMLVTDLVNAKSDYKE